ncbi:ribonuclease P protein component [Chloroflexota bacterium]
MRGKQWLRKSRQYALVYNEGRSWANKLVVMKAVPNSLDFTRCGISVSRRVGNAVSRNRLKRRLREILRLTPLEPGWDIIFIARPPANTDYGNLNKAVADLFLRAGLLKTAGDDDRGAKCETGEA